MLIVSMDFPMFDEHKIQIRVKENVTKNNNSTKRL